MKPAICHLSASKSIGILELLIAFCFLILFTFSNKAWAESCTVTDKAPLLTNSNVVINPIYTTHDGLNCSAPAYSDPITLDSTIFQSVFSNQIANYTEGKYQTDIHRQENLSDLAVKSPAQFNFFFGASQKVFPQYPMDLLRVNYIKYFQQVQTDSDSTNDLPTQEANATYTDSQGQNPKTILDLITFCSGLPNPPSFEGGVSQQVWASCWGKYWEKIPTSTNKRALGKLNFVFPDKCTPTGFPDGPTCGFDINVPEFPRLSGVSNSLNNLLLPNDMQQGVKLNMAYENNSISKSLASNQTQNLTVLGASQNSGQKSGQVKGATTCPGETEGELGSGESFCSPSNGCSGAQMTCSPLGTDGWTCTFTIPILGSNAGVASCGECTQIDASTWKCPLDLQLVAKVPYLQQIWNNSTYSNEGDFLNSQATKKNIPGFFDWFTPSLTNPTTNQVQTYASDPKYKKAGEAGYNLVQGTATGSSQVLSSSTDQNFYPRYIGGTNKFRQFVQFNALSPISGGIGSEVYIPQPKPSITPGPNPSPTPPPAGCDTITYDGSVHDIQSYVWCSVTGNEPKTGRELKRVMTETMLNESTGGNQCAVGTCAEIGVFQYIPSTWQYTSNFGFAQNWKDSGSGTYNNGKTVCWVGSGGLPGQDPVPILSGPSTCQPAVNDPDSYNWAKMFQGVGYDGGAWDPYLQTDATAHLMADGQACRWCGYVDYLIQTPPAGMTGVQYAQQLCPGSCTYLY